MTGLRRVRSLAYGAYAWACVLAIGAPGWIALALIPDPRARWRLMRLVSRLLCLVTGTGFEVEGRLPETVRPYVIVANHGSFIDGLAIILASPQPVVFAASSVFARRPIAGIFLRRLGCEFVGRRGAERPSLVIGRLGTVLERGDSLAVFPEGSITTLPGVRRFRAGAFVVAAEHLRPVVPIGIQGAAEIAPPGSRLPRRGTIRVVIGRPIQPLGDRPGAVADLANEARSAVAAMTGLPLASRF
jgi:1-acyl-sn-glycerol-3-phosphate acyltransferase